MIFFHPHILDYRPHPIPIHLTTIPTKHIPIPIPNAIDSCTLLWNLQVRFMQHLYASKADQTKNQLQPKGDEAQKT